MEKENDFDTLLEQLQKMEERQKLDLSVVNIFDKLIKGCQETEQFWIEQEKIPIESSFLLYHASRNSRLVIEKMKERFITALQTHENPKVVNDSLMIVPVLSELCQAISSLKSKTITFEMQLFVSNRLKLLRNMASNVSMLPSPEEEIKGLDKKKLKKRFDRFTGTLQAMFVEI